MSRFPLIGLVVLALAFTPVVAPAATMFYTTDIINSTGGIAAISTDGNVSTFVAGLDGLWGLAFDRSGNLYVSHNLVNGYVSKITPDGGNVSTFVGGLNEALGIAFDASGNLFVANNGNGTISKIIPDGSGVSTFATGLNHPAGVAIDSYGNVYVSTTWNSGNDTIVKISPDGKTARTFATGLSGPDGLTFDSSGNLYVANLDWGTISKITPDGTASTFATGFSDPCGLAFDSAGNLYVNNWGANGIMGTDCPISKVSPDGKSVSTFATGLYGPTGMVAAPVPALAPEPTSLALLTAAGMLMLRRSRTGR